jgi:hypothetical protein
MKLQPVVGRVIPAAKIPLAVIVALVALGGVCSAHQKWLLPNFFVAEKGPVWLSFDVTWSDRPFVAESAVGPKPLWIVFPDGRREAPSDSYVGKTKSVGEMQLSEPGTYRLESVDPLNYWTQVEVDGKKQWLRKSKDEVAGQKISRSDLYWSKAAAYVTLGKATDVPPADNTEPLDLLLSAHPNQLKVGDTITVRAVLYGKPLKGEKVNVFGPDSTGHEPTAVKTTAADGSAEYQFTTAGKFLLACQFEQKKPDDPKADIHSFNFYLTLEVAPQAK